MGKLVTYKVSVTMEVEIRTDLGMVQANSDAVNKVGDLFAQRATSHGVQSFIDAVDSINIRKVY